MVAVDRKFEFELVSPERLLLSEPVDMAVIPGSEGDFGVLAGHSLLISTLRSGVIEVWQGETVTNRLFVVGGFAKYQLVPVAPLAPLGLLIQGT